MGTVVSLPKMSPLEKQLVVEGKLDRSSLISRASSKMSRTLSRQEQRQVLSACEGLLQSRRETRAKERADAEAALKVEWQDGEPITEEEASDIVQRSWSRIQKQHRSYFRKRTRMDNFVTGWRVVRIFVSSTFSDFFSEREALVKKVFPELKEWCEARNLQLIECDLRWGVPKDSTTEATICTCLEEIDRCHDETDGEAFFLNMLGERYGWIPTSRDVPIEIIHEYEWVPNLSITHMETLRGALLADNPNALFMIRDPSYLSNVPLEHVKKFLDEDELPKAQLKELKRYVRENFPDQVYDYRCQVEGVDDSTGMELVKLVGLDDFCQHVLNFFKTAIGRKYPHNGEPLTQEEEENEQHWNYVMQKGQTVFGQDRLIRTLLSFAQGDSSVLHSDVVKRTAGAGKCVQGSPQILVTNGDVANGHNLSNGDVVMMSSNGMGDGDNDDIIAMETCPPNVNGTDLFTGQNGTGRPGSGTGHRSSKRVKGGKVQMDSWMLVVAGNSGTGKSAVMAKTVIEARQAGFNVFYHFVGACPTSIYSDNLIKRLCEYLLPQGDERRPRLKEEYSSEETVKLLHQLLKEKSSMLEQLLIVVDAVNQLTDDYNISHLNWFPPGISGHSIRCLLSIVENAKALPVLRDFTPQPYELAIGQLNTSTRIDIVQHYLGRFNKRLDPHQLALLTKSNGAQNALWLTLSCEELRIFGVFEKVTDRIKSLPEDLDALLAEILDRLVREDDSQCIEKTLCLIYCSQAGLPETELQMLLGDAESGTVLPMLIWGQVRRTLRPFLRNIGLVGNVERLDFFHQAIAKAVKSAWVRDDKQKQAVHLQLADFYQYHESGAAAAPRELPYQLQRAGKIQRLMDFLQTDARAKQISVGVRSRIIKEYRCKRVIMNPKAGMGRKLMMCHFCQMKRGAFSVSPIQNKDSCVLCGNFVHFKKEENIAYLCQFHMPRSPPSCEICCICRKIFPGGGPHGPIPGYLCLWCKHGIQPVCVKVMTETDNY